jgi:hypothetical protein
MQNPHSSEIKFSAILILISLLLPSKIFAQQSDLSKAVNYLSGFIASNYFKSLYQTNDDLALADTIYLRALHFENYNYSNALFDLTFAVIPYNKVHIRLPLIGIDYVYHLTSAEEKIFMKKNENLPKRLFFDTPRNNYGDKDKLAHFFGSAYIAYSSNFFDLGDLIGYFVEVFEQDFEVQNTIDFRDIETNYLGNMFGEILKKDKTILPSQVMMIRTFFYLRYHL